MLQIIGTKKNRESAKAERYAKERGISYQFVDLTKKELSEKEWESILDSADNVSDLIDKNSSYYKKNGYEWRDYNAAEELVQHPELLMLPVLRSGNKAFSGFSPEFIEENR